MAARWACYSLLALSCYFAFEYVFAHINADSIGNDFVGTLWEPGRAVIDGEAPYPDQALFGSPSVYPPPPILLFTPLALLPFHVAAAVMAALLFAAAALTLVVLGVRDWFVYALTLTSLAVLGASMWGNTTLLMILFVALAWRDRARSWVWVASAILVKLWMLPLLLWLAFTRPRQAALALFATATALAVGWAVIGGDGLTDYPARLSGLVDAQAGNGILVYASVLQLSGSSTVATAVSLGLAALLCMVSLGLDERRMFQLLLVACLVASPIAWSDYLGLLIVAIAVSDRRCDRTMWLALPALWMLIISPPGLPRPIWLIAYVIVLVAIVSTLAMDVHVHVRTRVAGHHLRARLTRT